MEASSLFYAAATYSSDREDRLSVRMEACLLSIQLLYTTHLEKADSLSEWLELVLGLRLKLGLRLGVGGAMAILFSYPPGKRGG